MKKVMLVMAMVLGFGLTGCGTRIFGCPPEDGGWNAGCHSALNEYHGRMVFCHSCVPGCKPSVVPGHASSSANGAWGESTLGRRHIEAIYKPFVDACEACAGPEAIAACQPVEEEE